MTLLSGTAASTIVVACPLELVVVTVVMVVDDCGSLVVVAGFEGGSVVVGEFDFVGEEEVEVLVGMMVAREGGKVVCPEVKTAHAPDKNFAPEAASAELQLTVTQPVNPPMNWVLLVPQ